MHCRFFRTVAARLCLFVAVALCAPGATPVAAQPDGPTLTILHAAPSLGPLMAFLDGRPVGAAFDVGVAQGAPAPPSGSVRLVVVASSDMSSVLLDTAIEASPSGATLVVLVGTSGEERRLRAVVVDLGAGGTGPGRARLRFVNGDPLGGSAALLNLSGGAFAEGVEFAAPREITIEAGRLRLRAQWSDSAVEAADQTLDAEPGRTYALVLTRASGDGAIGSLLVVPGPRAGVVPAGGSSAASGSPLIREDFSDPATGILPAAAPPGSILEHGYADGEYWLRNSGVETRSVAVPGDYTNATIAVDARLVGAIDGRTVSVGCRFRTDATGNYGYRLRVEPGTGLFRLVREDGTRDTLLVNLRRSTAINRGLAVNRLELTCSGTTITGSINGVQVVNMQDSTYSSGPLTLGVGARMSGLTSEARFDNLVVIQR